MWLGIGVGFAPMVYPSDDESSDSEDAGWNLELAAVDDTVAEGGAVTDAIPLPQPPTTAADVDDEYADARLDVGGGYCSATSSLGGFSDLSRCPPYAFVLIPFAVLAIDIPDFALATHWVFEGDSHARTRVGLDEFSHRPPREHDPWNSILPCTIDKCVDSLSVWELHQLLVWHPGVAHLRAASPVLSCPDPSSNLLIAKLALELEPYIPSPNGGRATFVLQHLLHWGVCFFGLFVTKMFFHSRSRPWVPTPVLDMAVPYSRFLRVKAELIRFGYRAIGERFLVDGGYCYRFCALRPSGNSSIILVHVPADEDTSALSFVRNVPTSAHASYVDIHGFHIAYAEWTLANLFCWNSRQSRLRSSREQASMVAFSELVGTQGLAWIEEFGLPKLTFIELGSQYGLDVPFVA